MSTASPYSPPPAPTPDPQPTPTPDNDPSMMTWIDHLKELRNRLMKASLAVLVGLVLGVVIVFLRNYAFLDVVADHLTPINPATGEKIVVQAIKPGEIFTNAMRVALGIGIALAMPVIVYQLLAYVAPGLTTRERRIIYLILPFVVLSFVAGLAFGWFITVPAAFRFLLVQGVGNFDVRPTVEFMLSLFTRLMLINGVLFELPLVVYSLIWLGVVERKTLAKYRRYSILIITIISAVVSPTGDATNLAFIAIPMYLLYELGLLLAWIAPRKKTVIVTPDGTK
jgi:sec-independent protein translocase protein TatC